MEHNLYLKGSLALQLWRSSLVQLVLISLILTQWEGEEDYFLAAVVVMVWRRDTEETLYQIILKVCVTPLTQYLNNTEGFHRIFLFEFFIFWLCSMLQHKF